jgi:hypothetical protein
MKVPKVLTPIRLRMMTRMSTPPVQPAGRDRPLGRRSASLQSARKTTVELVRLVRKNNRAREPQLSRPVVIVCSAFRATPFSPIPPPLTIQRGIPASVRPYSAALTTFSHRSCVGEARRIEYGRERCARFAGCLARSVKRAG